MNHGRAFLKVQRYGQKDSMLANGTKICGGEINWYGGGGVKHEFHSQPGHELDHIINKVAKENGGIL